MILPCYTGALLANPVVGYVRADVPGRRECEGPNDGDGIAGAQFVSSDEAVIRRRMEGW
jgi:hypothetical protein